MLRRCSLTDVSRPSASLGPSRAPTALRRGPATLLLAWAASGCGGGATVTAGEAFDLDLDLVFPVDQDPLADGPDLIVRVGAGEGTRDERLGGSDGGTWSFPDLEQLSGTALGLAFLDPGASLSPLDHDDLRGWGQTPPLDVAEGDTTTVTVLVGRYGELGEVGTLSASQVSHGAALAVLPDGDMLVIGGADQVVDVRIEAPTGNNHLLRLSRLDDDLEFDRVLDLPEWPGAPAERFGATATVVEVDGRTQVLVVGGRDGVIPTTRGANRAFLYDPADNAVTWNQVTESTRSEHVAVRAPDGRVLLLGGYGTPTAAPLSWDVFDPEVPRITAGGSANDLGAVGFGWADLGEAGVLVCGGGLQTGPGSDLFAQTGCRVVRVGEAGRPRADLGDGLSGDGPFGRMHHAMAPLPDGRVLLTGGVSEALPSDGASPALATAWTLDTTDPNARWEALSPGLSTPRAMHTMIPLPDGRVWIVGGVSEAGWVVRDNVGTPVPCPEIFDPADDSFTPVEGCNGVGRGALPRWALGPDHGVLVLTGFDATNAGGDLWGWIATGPDAD